MHRLHDHKVKVKKYYSDLNMSHIYCGSLMSENDIVAQLHFKKNAVGLTYIIPFYDSPTGRAEIDFGSPTVRHNSPGRSG